MVGVHLLRSLALTPCALASVALCACRASPPAETLARPPLAATAASDPGSLAKGPGASPARPSVGPDLEPAPRGEEGAVADGSEPDGDERSRAPLGDSEAPGGSAQPDPDNKDDTASPPASPPPSSPLSSAVLLLSAWNLPEDWLSLDRRTFEQELDRWFPAERSPALSATSLQSLGQALDRDDEGAVRAAIVLARSRDPEGRETLLVHLERRIGRGPERGGNATDVVAAAAFDPSVVPPPPDRPRPRDERTREPGFRLEALASGSRPHPDLEVRVECARSALALGRDGVIPFLLRVLREGTTAATPAPDWKRGGEIAWAQSRAAGALSRRAGVPVAYAPEGSIAEREAEAARLEQRLPKPRKPKR